MTNIGYASMQVIPVLAGVSEAVAKQLGPLSDQGKKIGQSLGDGLAAGVDLAAKKVEQAASKTVAARNKEADAAGKLRVAEAQLQSLIDKGVTDAGKLATAEEKVAKTKRDHETAAKTLTRTVKEETAAQDHLAEAKKRVDKAADSATKSGGRFSNMMSGLKGKISGTAGSLDGLGGKIKGLGSTISSNLGIGLAGGIVGIGASLLAMGDQFAQVNKTIAYTTGASGEKLEGLNESVRNIGKSTPKSLGDIATAMANVAKTTQLTGAPLEALTKQMIKLDTRGQSVDITGLTQSMRAFGVPADQMSGKLDQIFKVATATGTPVSDLVGTLQSGAPQLKQFGLSIEDAAGMLGGLKLAGINSEAAMAGLRKALGTVSKQGGDVKTNLKNAVTEIKRMSDAGDQAGAIAASSKLFGGKAYLPMLEAIKAGKLNLDEMNASLGDNQKGIMESGGAVVTMSGAWELLKNNVMIELEPIVTKIFTAMQDGIMWFRTNGVGIIQGFKNNMDWIAPVAAGVGAMVVAWKAWTAATKAWSIVTGIATAVQTAFNAATKANVIGIVILAIVGLVAALTVAYKRSETFRNIVNSVWAGIKSVVGAVWGWISTTLWPGLKTVFEGIGKVAMWLWRNVITPAWTGIKAAIGIAWTVIKGYFSVWMTVFKAAANAVLWLWNNAVVPAWNGIKTAISVAWDLIKGYFDIWMSIYKKIGDVALWLWNNVMVPAWDGIKAAISAAAGVIGPVIETVKGFFQGLITKAGEVWQGVVDKFTGMVDFVKSLPGKIADAATGMWDGLKNGLKAAINWIIKAWNGLADKLSMDLPTVKIFGKEVGGGHLNLLPRLPELATGGYTGDIPADRVAGVVHGGEFVIKAASTTKLENAYPGLLSFLNGQGRLPGVPGVPGFDSGGFVPKGAEGLNPGAEYLRDLVLKNWPQITRIGGRRSEDGFGEHSSGNAIDIMIPNYKTADGVALGNSVLAFLQKNAAAFNVNGIIWQRMSYGYGHGLGSAQDYGEHGGDTKNHMDHLHVILGAGRRAGAAPVGMPTGLLLGLPGSEKPKETPSSSLDLAKPAAADSAAGDGSGAGAGGFQMPDSITGLSSMWSSSIPALKTKVTPDSPERTLDIGALAGTAVSGQVASALDVFGVGDSPGFLKAASKLVGGISIGGPTGGGAPDAAAAPAAAAVPHAAAIPDAAAGAMSGPQPGPSTVFNIQTARTEDAFVLAQQREKERAASKLSRY